MLRTPARRGLVLGAGVLMLSVLAVQAGATGPLPHVTPYSPTGTYAEGSSLVSGRLVSPAGRRTTLGDFPVALAVSPDNRTGVVADSGQGEGASEQSDQALQVVDLASGRVVQTVRDHEKGAPTFYNAGLSWSRDGRHLYATGGGNDQVYDYTVAGQHLTLAARWKSSAKAGAPTVPGSANGGIPGSAPLVGDVAAYSRGVAVTPDGATALVTNEQGSSVAALSTKDGSLRWETQLAAPYEGGAYPGAITLSDDGARAYVAAQGLNAVVTLETAHGAIVGTTPVGDHPVAVTRAGTALFVANANDDSLSVLDASGAVPTATAQLSTHLVTGEANGSTPDAVGVDAQRGRVYVALAGDNAVAVFDTNKTDTQRFSALQYSGAIPAGYYPTALGVLANGHVVTASAKGLGGAPITDKKQYIVNRRSGLLTDVPGPGGSALAGYTATARRNLLEPTKANALRPKDSPIPDEIHRGSSPIKHVVMIVRENRTFDQVFGDLRRKDADVQPAYTEFGARNRQGKTVTPNIHALAQRFGLSQNFYSDGEASIQGHHWTAEGVSSDYTEKSYLHYYSSRNHPYDPTAPIVYPRCGAVFQQLAAQGHSFRNFGELVGLATSQAPTVAAAPGAACATPGGRYDAASVANHSDNLGANLSLTSVKDTDKEKDIESELAPLVAADRMPEFTYAVLGNDHTDGTAAGKKTPQAHVATNDLAVGKLVDYLSHTKQWSSTAVFVVEDDSQDGLDHRDGHRNVLLVASPWARKGALSSLHVSQASVLHTVELILGMAPLSSYTQYAPVPYDLFTSKPDLTPYTAQTPTYDMAATNPAATPGTAAAVPVDLRVVDVAGPVLEAQIWEATHPGVGMPAALLAELRSRGGIREEALEAWAHGQACTCNPLRDGLTVAPGEGDGA
jgi:6-phosphogluconolactonase (cycloisomerase 2 family)